jgi:hypothetical protein
VPRRYSRGSVRPMAANAAGEGGQPRRRGAWPVDGRRGCGDDDFSGLVSSEGRRGVWPGSLMASADVRLSTSSGTAP